MPEYLSPGVYVEEVSGGAKPIEAVGTSTACFVGFTERVPKPKVKDVKNPDKTMAGQPIFVTSWEEYVANFGSFVPNYFTPLSVYAFFQNGGKRCYVVSLREVPKASFNVQSTKMLEGNKPFLKIQSKVPGENGEQLRVKIKRVEDRTPIEGGAKFTLKITEEGTTAPATTTQPVSVTHTITFVEAEDRAELSRTITLGNGNPLINIEVPEKIEKTLAELFTPAIDETVQQLSWERTAGRRLPLIKITPQDANATGSLKIRSSLDGKTCVVTIEANSVVTQTAAGNGAPRPETLVFTLNDQDDDGNDIVTLKPMDGSASTLVNVAMADGANTIGSDIIFDVWPKGNQNIALTKVGEAKEIECSNKQKKLLRVTPQKGDGDFKPLTVTVESQQLQKSEFKLIVERKSASAWKTVEERSVSLRKRIKRGIFDGEDKLRTLLEVEYLNGQIPTTVDVLTVKPDLETKDIDLFGIWPIEQSAAVDSPNMTKLLIDRDDERRQQLLAPARYDEFQGDAMERTGMGGLAEIDDINFICMPDLMKAWKDDDKESQKYVKSVQALAIAHCDTLRNRVVILDPPPNMNPQEIKKWRQDTAAYDSSRAMLYYPWVEAMDPVSNQTTFVPPSGFVAGIWARNDITRGVHKAPANEVVQLAVGLQFDVGQGHQDILNPNGINCIRQLRGMGIRVWGARTLSQSDPEWRYINVRRLFHMIEQSIQRSTMWAVFEPNDQRLWAKLRRDVGNFLMLLYSQGMLFGATASQAFFVKCDETNNPKYVRDAGQVIIDIGVAPVKPAEFVVFRIRQWSPEDEQV
jgi:phage tail sheath protein FI